MENKEQYTESPPSYAFPPSSQYPTTDPAPSPYSAPAPGPTSYPPPPSQEDSVPSQQYPPATGHAPYGQAYAGYPGEPQKVVVVSAPAQQPMTVHHVPSFVAHIILACVVVWLCNCLFGLIAFTLASQYTLFAISYY